MAARRSSGRSRKETHNGGTELLVTELREIHSAENQLAKAMPRLSKSIESERLRDMLEHRLDMGERIIHDIESALEELEAMPARRARNASAEGLMNHAREHLEDIEPGPALDAKLIGSLQKAEHYCIAAWGTARAMAMAMGRKGAAKAMERALKEGKDFDVELTVLAEEEITPALLEQSSGEAAERTTRRGAPRRGRRASRGAEARA